MVMPGDSVSIIAFMIYVTAIYCNKNGLFNYIFTNNQLINISYDSISIVE